MARDALLYIFDPQAVERLTLGGQSQAIHRCGALFWKYPPGFKVKHYFNRTVTPIFSEDPCWTNIIS